MPFLIFPFAIPRGVEQAFMPFLIFPFAIPHGVEQAFMLLPFCNAIPRRVEQAFMPAVSASISTALAAVVKVSTTKQVSGHDFSRAARRSN
ncbi:MAG TPA: hypothetical protein VGK01_10865 [Candidatus Angelobacter sp.]|jgi:hypothetical protein